MHIRWEKISRLRRLFSARLLIDFKNSKWLIYFCILSMHLYGLLSETWLSLLYKLTRFFIYFLFLSDEGPMLETLDYTIRIGSSNTCFLYFDLHKNRHFGIEKTRNRKCHVPTVSLIIGKIIGKWSLSVMAGLHTNEAKYSY